MFVFFCNGRQLRRGMVITIVALLLFGLVLNRDLLMRRFLGVRPGVKLEGRDLTGMLPHEVTALVKGLAARVEQLPLNASYFPETGEIIPARAGKLVRVAETVNSVCAAPAAADLKLRVQEVSPAIREDFFRPIFHGNRELPRVALTINVAWGEEHLEEMLRVLKEEKVKATFFLVGTWVKKFPELARKLEQEGHELANHGLYHGHPLQMRRDELKRLILENATLIKETIGKEPVKYFAPPYGEQNMQVVGAAGALGYRTIMWSVDSIDWKLPAPEVLLERVLGKIEPGGIILLHPTVSTKEALRRLIQGLRKKGLEPGTVSKVLQKSELTTEKSEEA